MGVELAVRSDQPAFRSRHLAAAVDQSTFRPYQRHRVGECADEVELQSQGRVDLTPGSVECTAHPMAESSMVANQPPCTVPIGL